MPGGLLVVGPSDSLANKQEQLLAMQAELQREQQARAQAEAVTLICKYALDAYIAMVMNGLAAELVTQAALKQLVDNFVASLAQGQQAPLTAAKVAEQLPQGQEFDALCRQVVRNATPSPTPSEHEEQAPSRLVKVPSATDLSELMQKGTRSAPPSPGRRLSGRKGSEGELPNFDFQDLASRAQRSGSASSLPDLENAPYQSVSIEQLLEDKRTLDQYFAERFGEFQQRLKTQSPAPTRRYLQTPPTPERGSQPNDSERAKRTLFVGERGEQETPTPTSLADLVAQVDVPEAGQFPKMLDGHDLNLSLVREVKEADKQLSALARKTVSKAKAMQDELRGKQTKLEASIRVPANLSEENARLWASLCAGEYPSARAFLQAFGEKFTGQRTAANFLRPTAQLYALKFSLTAEQEKLRELEQEYRQSTQLWANEIDAAFKQLAQQRVKTWRADSSNKLYTEAGIKSKRKKLSEQELLDKAEQELRGEHEAVAAEKMQLKVLSQQLRQAQEELEALTQQLAEQSGDDDEVLALRKQQLEKDIPELRRTQNQLIANQAIRDQDEFADSGLYELFNGADKARFKSREKRTRQQEVIKHLELVIDVVGDAVSSSKKADPCAVVVQLLRGLPPANTKDTLRYLGIDQSQSGTLCYSMAGVLLLMQEMDSQQQSNYQARNRYKAFSSKRPSAHSQGRDQTFYILHQAFDQLIAWYRQAGTQEERAPLLQAMQLCIFGVRYALPIYNIHAQLQSLLSQPQMQALQTVLFRATTDGVGLDIKLLNGARYQTVWTVFSAMDSESVHKQRTADAQEFNKSHEKCDELTRRAHALSRACAPQTVTKKQLHQKLKEATEQLELLQGMGLELDDFEVVTQQCEHVLQGQSPAVYTERLLLALASGAHCSDVPKLEAYLQDQLQSQLLTSHQTLWLYVAMYVNHLNGQHPVVRCSMLDNFLQAGVYFISHGADHLDLAIAHLVRFFETTDGFNFLSHLAPELRNEFLQQLDLSSAHIFANLSDYYCASDMQVVNSAWAELLQACDFPALGLPHSLQVIWRKALTHGLSQGEVSLDCQQLVHVCKEYQGQSTLPEVVHMLVSSSQTVKAFMSWPEDLLAVVGACSSAQRVDVMLSVLQLHEVALTQALVSAYSNDLIECLRALPADELLDVLLAMQGTIKALDSIQAKELCQIFVDIEQKREPKIDVHNQLYVAVLESSVNGTQGAEEALAALQKILERQSVDHKAMRELLAQHANVVASLRLSEDFADELDVLADGDEFVIVDGDSLTSEELRTGTGERVDEYIWKLRTREKKERSKGARSYDKAATRVSQQWHQKFEKELGAQSAEQIPPKLKVVEIKEAEDEVAAVSPRQEFFDNQLDMWKYRGRQQGLDDQSAVGVRVLHSKALPQAAEAWAQLLGLRTENILTVPVFTGFRTWLQAYELMASGQAFKSVFDLLNGPRKALKDTPVAEEGEVNYALPHSAQRAAVQCYRHMVRVTLPALPGAGKPDVGKSVEDFVSIAGDTLRMLQTDFFPAFWAVKSEPVSVDQYMQALQQFIRELKPCYLLHLPRMTHVLNLLGVIAEQYLSTVKKDTDKKRAKQLANVIDSCMVYLTSPDPDEVALAALQQQLPKVAKQGDTAYQGNRLVTTIAEALSGAKVQRVVIPEIMETKQQANVEELNDDVRHWVGYILSWVHRNFKTKLPAGWQKQEGDRYVYASVADFLASAPDIEQNTFKHPQLKRALSELLRCLGRDKEQVVQWFCAVGAQDKESQRDRVEIRRMLSHLEFVAESVLSAPDVSEVVKPASLDCLVAMDLIADKIFAGEAVENVENCLTAMVLSAERTLKAVKVLNQQLADYEAKWLETGSREAQLNMWEVQAKLRQYPMTQEILEEELFALTCKANMLLAYHKADKKSEFEYVCRVVETEYRKTTCHTARNIPWYWIFTNFNQLSEDLASWKEGRKTWSERIEVPPSMMPLLAMAQHYLMAETGVTVQGQLARLRQRFSVLPLPEQLRAVYKQLIAFAGGARVVSRPEIMQLLQQLTSINTNEPYWWESCLPLFQQLQDHFSANGETEKGEQCKRAVAEICQVLEVRAAQMKNSAVRQKQCADMVVVVLKTTNTSLEGVLQRELLGLRRQLNVYDPFDVKLYDAQPGSAEAAQVQVLSTVFYRQEEQSGCDLLSLLGRENTLSVLHVALQQMKSSRHPCKDAMISQLLMQNFADDQELSQQQAMLRLLDACSLGSVGVPQWTAEQFLAYLRTFDANTLLAIAYPYECDRLSNIASIGDNVLSFVIDTFYIKYCLMNPANPLQSAAYLKQIQAWCGELYQVEQKAKPVEVWAERAWTETVTKEAAVFCDLWQGEQSEAVHWLARLEQSVQGFYHVTDPAGQHILALIQEVRSGTKHWRDLHPAVKTIDASGSRLYVEVVEYTQHYDARAREKNQLPEQRKQCFMGFITSREGAFSDIQTLPRDKTGRDLEVSAGEVLDADYTDPSLTSLLTFARELDQLQGRYTLPKGRLPLQVMVDVFGSMEVVYDFYDAVLPLVQADRVNDRVCSLLLSLDIPKQNKDLKTKRQRLLVARTKQLVAKAEAVAVNDLKESAELKEVATFWRSLNKSQRRQEMGVRLFASLERLFSGESSNQRGDVEGVRDEEEPHYHNKAAAQDRLRSLVERQQRRSAGIQRILALLPENIFSKAKHAKDLLKYLSGPQLAQLYHEAVLEGSQLLVQVMMSSDEREVTEDPLRNVLLSLDLSSVEGGEDKSSGLSLLELQERLRQQELKLKVAQAKSAEQVQALSEDDIFKQAGSEQQRFIIAQLLRQASLLTSESPYVVVSGDEQEKLKLKQADEFSEITEEEAAYVEAVLACVTGSGLLIQINRPELLQQALTVDAVEYCFGDSLPAVYSVLIAQGGAISLENLVLAATLSRVKVDTDTGSLSPREAEIRKQILGLRKAVVLSASRELKVMLTSPVGKRHRLRDILTHLLPEQRQAILVEMRGFGLEQQLLYRAYEEFVIDTLRRMTTAPSFDGAIVVQISYENVMKEVDEATLLAMFEWQITIGTNDITGNQNLRYLLSIDIPATQTALLAKQDQLFMQAHTGYIQDLAAICVRQFERDDEVGDLEEARVEVFRRNFEAYYTSLPPRQQRPFFECLMPAALKLAPENRVWLLANLCNVMSTRVSVIGAEEQDHIANALQTTDQAIESTYGWDQSKQILPASVVQLLEAPPPSSVDDVLAHLKKELQQLKKGLKATFGKDKALVKAKQAFADMFSVMVDVPAGCDEIQGVHQALQDIFCQSSVNVANAALTLDSIAEDRQLQRLANYYVKLRNECVETPRRNIHKVGEARFLGDKGHFWKDHRVAQEARDHLARPTNYSSQDFN